MSITTIMTEKTIVNRLNELAAYESRKMEIEAQRQAEKDAILTDSIRAQLAEIDRRYAEMLAPHVGAIGRIAEEIKVGVLALGMSVKANHIHAIYSNGRVTWDTRALDGYAAAHPEIKEFRKVGQPSVSLRSVSGKK